MCRHYAWTRRSDQDELREPCRRMAKCTGALEGQRSSPRPMTASLIQAATLERAVLREVARAWTPVSSTEGSMDIVSALGVWTLCLVGIAGVVYAARAENNVHRQLRT